MKWYVIIDDYGDKLGKTLEMLIAGQLDPRIPVLLRDLSGSIKFTFEASFKTPGDFLNAYCANRGQHDHAAIVFNGHPMLAGPANDAFLTLKYNEPGAQNRELTHFMHPLVDRIMTTQLTKENAEAFCVEVISNLLKRFCYDVELPSDKMPLEEKRRRIDHLESIWRGHDDWRNYGTCVGS